MFVFSFVRAEEEVLLVLMDLIPVPSKGKMEEILDNMISFSEDWLILLSAVHSQSRLLQHPTLAAVHHSLQSLTDPQRRRQFPVNFFSRLDDSKISLLAKFCTLASPLVPSVALNVHQCDDYWMSQFKSDQESARYYSQLFLELEKTINLVEKVSKGIVTVSDVHLLMDELNRRKKEWSATTSLKDVFDTNYWGKLHALIDLAKPIGPVSESAMFTNVARSCVTLAFSTVESQMEVGLNVDVDSDSKAESCKVKTAAEILFLIEGRGFQQFKEASANIFDDSKDPSLKEVDMLLQGIGNQDKLDTELQIIKSIRGVEISRQRQKMLINYLKFPSLKAKVKQVMSMFSALGFDDSTGASIGKELQDFMSFSCASNQTLGHLSKAVENGSVATIDHRIDETLTTLITVLHQSSELILFMKETAGEDIRILIDAVEEHSDQFVSEATVSDLIDVHGFLQSVLREDVRDPLLFLDHLESCYVKLEKKVEMAAKIIKCRCNVHSLRGLYMNVANRGEMTKEIISNAVQKGRYLIKANLDGSCEIQLSYCRHETTPKETTYNMAELHDLRSRALLIVNTDANKGKVTESVGHVAMMMNTTMTTFITQVERLNDILNIITLLRESGHQQYSKNFWHKLHSLEEINSLADSLAVDLEQWQKILHNSQTEHYFLNFFHPDQLWILHEFFTKGLTNKSADIALKTSVHSLLRFVDQNVKIEDVVGFHSLYSKPKEHHGYESDLRAIGQVLDAIFIPRQGKKVQMVPKLDLQGTVKPGELFVAVLEQGSKQTAHVVMSLFKNTTGACPEPNQVIFCHSETSWEEVERLLKRAFLAHDHSNSVTLHCLANVENLPNDIQFALVDAIREHQQRTKGPYLLGLICCGGSHHHIADQFSSWACNIMGMTEVQLRTTFNSKFPEVCMVTSDLPGAGKTEAIHELAASQKKKVVTVPISGPLNRKNLVRRLSGLQFRPFECIHFDVGEVDDPSILDIFFFELVAVGMVSFGTDVFHLPTHHVYIEIANTLSHWLRDSLAVTKCFSTLHIKSNGYKDLIVSQEPLSPIQVVCQYLHAYDSGKLEGEDLRPEELKPLTSERCKKLLLKHFSSSGDLSFNIVESFVKVFANQLLQFSASPYFKPQNLKAVLGHSHNTRNCLFKALLEVSREFASRSVMTCKNVQSEAISREEASELLKKIQMSSCNVAVKMVERVEGMIQWADNNHLVIVFHGLEALTISALYRDLSLVPSNVKDLFKTQAVKGKDMDDFTKMTQEELQRRLDLIVRSTPRESNSSFQILHYALTPDNILKMVLIIQRIRARIPVIVMGETGCGKTSLVRYLAGTCGVSFRVFNFHAGVREEEMVTFVRKVEEEAKSCNEVWVFLDEINTCEYLGTINEIICHRTIRGKPLVPNIVFIAACNPYRLRPAEKISTAGLSGKTVTDEYSRLVYRVHPLPETMIDFVWDYGSLSTNDERAYIGRMVEGITGNGEKLLVELLCTSQEYIREAEMNPYCVSLRDAYRCIVLVKWFNHTLKIKDNFPISRSNNGSNYSKATCTFSRQMKSIILALAHCYRSRLTTAAYRRGYHDKIASCIRKDQGSFKSSSFEDIVRAEQEDYLGRMELPQGTAKNAALRENVFVMLVCILNQIPVFVVGKPGCSKSLSMQIIRSNLRGKDAKDPFLKTLPQLYVVSHQGSESSTSDGILKVFEKAKKYRKHNTASDVLPVVLLDEIGLAEISKYNPLKVLHSLLEPSESSFPDVAVVGISNWALDAAKMNRAIHLSRPEPDVEDLYETGISLRDTNMDSCGIRVSSTRTYPNNKHLRYLAKAYYKYQGMQRYPNFHGLRDYYSLIKCLSTESKNDPSDTEEKNKRIQRALQRNFGGVQRDVKNFQSYFQEEMQKEDFEEETYHFLITDLICDNLHDILARHLMIITNGDSAIGILDQTLESLQKEKITIFGSQFQEDLSEEYNYRILSRIILCMERDCVLILRDLENIYGSLYDMLNQNYTVVGGKKNCRVALGAFSNPMCQVHDGFRCIVLIDQRRIDFTDPPFLNRFEKQLLRFSDVLNEEERNLINALKRWVKSISTVPNLESQFCDDDMFVGFCDDTLPSVVLKNSQDPELDYNEILEQCKEDLMMVASPDGVVRSMESDLAQTNLQEVQALHDNYFQKPLHSGLKNYLRHALQILENDSKSEDATSGMKLVVMTHSNINLSVSQCLEGLVKCQTEKLSAFKSEKQLTRELERFWRSKDSFLVLQCKPELDATHMLLAKCIIEQQRDQYIKEAIKTTRKQVKHVCIVIHVQRESVAIKTESQRWQFSFQSGWKQVTIDVLEHPVLSITECLDGTITDLLESKSLSFEDEALNQLLWCFTRIKYPSSMQPSLDAVLQINQLLKSCSVILECFKDLVVRWLKKRDAQNLHSTGLSRWQYTVACDREALINYSHLLGAIQHYISHLIRQPLAKIVYFLESESAWPHFLLSRDISGEEKLQVWLKLMSDEEILNIDKIPDQQGPESYYTSERCLDLKFPFASVFYKKVEQVQPMFVEDQRRLLLDETNLNDEETLREVAVESQLHKFASLVKEKIPQVYDLAYLQNNIELYVEDLLDKKTSLFSDVFARSEKIDFLKAAMAQDIKFVVCGDPALAIVRLHSLFWLNGSSYMTTLEVYGTCHSVSNVNIKDLLCKYIPLFERSLFQDKTTATLKGNENEQSNFKDVQYTNLNSDGEIGSQVTQFETSDETGTVAQSQGALESKYVASVWRQLEGNCEVDATGTVQVTQAGKKGEKDENEYQTQTPGGDDLAMEGCQKSFGVVERIDPDNSLHNADKSLTDQTTYEWGDADNIEVHVQCTVEEIVQDRQLQEEVETDYFDEYSMEEHNSHYKEELLVDDDEETVVTFEEEMVEMCCFSLLPTDDVVKSFQGVDDWHRTTSLFLATVIRMPVQNPAIHFLRVCIDFLSLVLVSDDLDMYSLYMLGELGRALTSEGYLDSPVAFDRITCIIDELQKRGIQDRRAADFLMTFYGRCIDSNPDSPVLSSILARISSSREKSFMQLAGPLIHRIFLVEEQLCPGVFENLLNGGAIDEHPGIQQIGHALQTQAGDDTLDCPFSALCCDLIGEVASWDVNVSSVSSSDDHLLNNFRRAFQTLVDPFDDTEYAELNLLCAAAYVKSVLASFVKFILPRRQCLVEDGEFSMVMQEIHSAFPSTQTNPGPSVASELQLFFLKELMKELYLFDVHKICQCSSQLPSLKGLHWKDEILIGKLSFDPFQKHIQDSPAQAALATLLEKSNLKPFEDVISNLPESAEQRLKVALLLTKSFYLIRSERNLRDSEDKASELFVKNMCNLEAPYVELLLRITGKKDFKSPELCISPESSSADVHKAMLILHLCSIVASRIITTNTKTLAFMSYLANPLKSQSMFVLASGESRQEPYMVHHNYSSEQSSQATIFSCACMTMFVTASKKEKTCPNCGSECQRQSEGKKNECPIKPHPPASGYVLIPGSQDTSHKVRNLKPAEFRILHLFVCSVLYGGYALGLFDDKCLTQILSTEQLEECPSELCFQLIENDLRALSILLDAKEKDVIRFLHCAIEDCTSLITTAVVCPTEESRLTWETKFSAVLTPLIHEFCVRKHLTRFQDYAPKSRLSVQRKIEETDCPHFPESEIRNQHHLSRLFRVTYPKTFKSLRAYYVAANNETRNGHPLLGLFLDFDESLPLVANLNDLLSWSRKVDSLLSRRLTRKDADQKIGDVIQKEVRSPEEKKRLNEDFEKFCKAWEKMRPLVCKQLKMEVPYISESSPISYCLVDKRGKGVFLCAALELLQNIQNDFLHKILSIAVTGKSSGLVFLERAVKKCAIPIVHLQDAREKEIIQYKWSDDILRHSQRNTEYGHGGEVFFDLEKIEKEMAARFLVGKSYLSTFNGLHEFIFSRELFHTSKGILDELQNMIPQEPLTEMLRSGLRSSEHSLEAMQDLLEHMEIVLCLLKRYQVGKPGDPLTDFTDKWLCGSRPFPKHLLPQPHSAIQLTHVVALYEFLEDRLAESASKRVHDAYRVDIPNLIEEEMVKAAPASGEAELDRSLLVALSTALRRFIFRYLLSEEIRPEPGGSLVEHLLESSLWPIDANKLCNLLKVHPLSKLVTSMISDKLTIGHTYQVLCFYQNRLKVSDR